MTTWATAVTELRTLLSDGPTDRYRFRKKCFGDCNGSNKTFKTFEFRRLTNFTSAAAPLGVYVAGAAATVTTDYPATGEFVLTNAPTDGQDVEASFYIQWFLDTELSTFMTTACQWLGLGETFANIPSGLRPAALRYAAAEAYTKMAMRWRERQSEMYRVEDAPDPKANGMTDEFLKMGDSFRDNAVKLRDSYYTRQGQNLQPYTGAVVGAYRDPTPRG